MQEQQQVGYIWQPFLKELKKEMGNLLLGR